MKKKIVLFVMLICAIFAFTGCNFTDSRINDILGDKDDISTLPDSVIVPPRSDESAYQSPVDVGTNPTPGQIVEFYLDCVVTVFIKNVQTGQAVSFGSGVCVYSGGYIATNYHVVSQVLSLPNTYGIYVYLNDSTTEYIANILWYDSTLDTAIIQCSNGDIPFVTINDRLFNETENPLQPLEQVITIGTPLDFTLQNSYSLGYISGLNRASISDQNIYETLIQHTASISSGCSGGPLFDMRGNLIGLNTLGSIEGNDIYFAVPIYPVEVLINRISTLNELNPRAVYTTPKLGVNITDSHINYIFGENIYSGSGVYITKIVSGDAVSKLEVSDIIVGVKISGVTVNVTCRNEMIFAILNYSKNDTITIIVLRSLQNIEINIKLT